MTKTITIPITTITPIWTGDADRRTSYLRATSFLGGLRFWTEALLRSSGQKVCSATGDDRCVLAPDKPQPCQACQIFGCTGLGRSFGLKVLESNSLPTKKAIGEIKLTRHAYDVQNWKGTVSKKTPTWFLSEKQGMEGWHVDFSLQYSPLRPAGEAEANHLALATRLLLHWGMLGAKDQYGYGLVKANTQDNDTLDNLWRKAFDEPLGTAAEHQHVEKNMGLPDLRDFYFFSGKYDPNGNREISQPDFPFEIRYQVRSGLRDPNDKQKDKDIRHYFCGSTDTDREGKRQATKFNMGLDGDTLYGWGYFPRTGAKAISRDRCLKLLKDTLIRNCKRETVKWKEFNAPGRDTLSSSATWGEFLGELAKQPWR